MNNVTDIEDYTINKNIKEYLKELKKLVDFDFKFSKDDENEIINRSIKYWKTRNNYINFIAPDKMIKVSSDTERQKLNKIINAMNSSHLKDIVLIQLIVIHHNKKGSRIDIENMQTNPDRRS